MAEAEMDVNQEAPESSPEETQAEEAQTQVEEGSTAQPEGQKETWIPKQRLDEVIAQRNEARKREQEFEERLRRIESGAGRPQEKSNDPVDARAQKLVALGVDKDVARAIAESSAELAEHTTRKYVQPIQEAQARKEIDAWKSQFQQSHADYQEVEPQMAKIWEGLSEPEREYVVNSPRGLASLYFEAKDQMASGRQKDIFEKGKQEAYKTQAVKQGLSSMPGKAKVPSKGLTYQEFSKLPETEKMERWDEYLASFKK